MNTCVDMCVRTGSAVSGLPVKYAAMQTSRSVMIPVSLPAASTTGTAPTS